MFCACLEVCLNTFWSWDPSKSECVKKEPPKIHEKMISSPPKWLALRWDPSKWLDSWSGGFLSSVLCVRCAAGASWSIGIGKFRTKHQRRKKSAGGARPVPCQLFRNRTAHLWKFPLWKKHKHLQSIKYRILWKYQFWMNFSRLES